MKRIASIGFVLMLFMQGALHADLPPLLKETTDNFDKAMKSYEATVEAIVKVDRDGYLIVLAAARKREERAKRDAGVSAIDGEIKAANAGPIPQNPPANLPADLIVFRTRYAGAPERATKDVASTRRFTIDSHLRWLEGMAGSAKRGNDPALEKAVEGEKQRILALRKKLALPEP